MKHKTMGGCGCTIGRAKGDWNSSVSNVFGLAVLCDAPSPVRPCSEGPVQGMDFSLGVNMGSDSIP